MQITQNKCNKTTTTTFLEKIKGRLMFMTFKRKVVHSYTFTMFKTKMKPSNKDLLKVSYYSLANN